MKKKVLILVAVAAMLGGYLTANTYAQHDVIRCADNGGGGGSGYSCTVTSNCGNQGSVSCTGQSCSRGWMWVECDGKRTDC